ncbi:MAG: hypothetical protein MK052_12370 [Alphaproteobacteria bacterium]|nr:hypothetical protein [Alphaproteobacteria bacterium]
MTLTVAQALSQIQGLTGMNRTVANVRDIVSQVDATFLGGDQYFYGGTAPDGTKMWQDADNDGVADAGEVISLDVAGIAEIALTTTTSTDAVRGNAITSEATVTFADTRTSTIADVMLERNPTDTQFTGDTSISSATAALPALRGYGEVTDLQVAMTDDATLLGLVDDVVALGASAMLTTGGAYA